MTTPIGNLNQFFRGDSKCYQLTFVTDNGSPIDVTGWDLWLTFKVNISDAEIASPLQLNYTMPSGSTSGVVMLYLDSTYTNALPIGTLFWDMQVVITVGSDKIVKTIGQGTVNIEADITRTF